MLVFRPASLADLSAIEKIAARSPVGVTSLPADRDRLYAKIEKSLASLDAEVTCNGEESYFFVLENPSTGAIVGVSGITASAGFNEPFYNYRNETLVHASRELGIHSKVHALSLCHDLTGNTLLTSFFLDDSYHYSEWSDLLSRGRLLLIAAHPQRFADTIVSEMLGVCDDDGNSPFWDSVGRHFFGIDYAQAELYCGVRGRSFIAELLPQHPIYVPLLTEAAQEAIGQVNPFSQLPFEILINEGFETERYVDIFDGGCVLQARTGHIHTIASQRRYHVEVGGLHGQGERFLVANTRLGQFRATVATLEPDAGSGTVNLPPALAAALQVRGGDTVLVAPL